MALGSDSSKMVLVLMDMPFCGRPRKPRPLISVILSAFVVHIIDLIIPWVPIKCSRSSLTLGIITSMRAVTSALEHSDDIDRQ
ncbi:uncharacterized protein EAF02_011978 [Botrytis sinoallii]|uniref:uncharacterized protein n=1 Tax=Botrytis sinoallii TaxID=1463999 RepID=UPI001900DAF4|nr:uncharacterized protein EAF02_011978 [Botrytis sinoallii]KAF7853324.1 hypothetical protein EAF02_011978 [Botrytis sinoallii]